MRVDQCRIPGLRLLRPVVHADDRGSFVKTFHAGWFADAGIPAEWPERFYSRSHRGVVRGLHFQTPPSSHAKLVYCVHGAVLDVVVDLRVGSPTFGEFELLPLDDDTWTIAFVPEGLAHGFAALTDDAVMAYATGTVHVPQSDTGIRWDSVPIPWPFDAPTVSARDEALPTFAEFASPFVYDQ
ncbi:MAG: dTDP-4-dehydrorhamnose 3,5-epimerase [Acidimicrobiaceae bacterium]|nr:dTDP-4-dehydrorhamnose 3,5-epimerase [Acidimicrobiaceae bacterium]